MLGSARTQVQKGCSYINMRGDIDLILEDERHIMVDEQKTCRARTRKFSLETNRRRKAQEERRREEDMREQRLREEILQQRRHAVQDVTERFQRAHLPPSQRKRQASRRATPHLEEALNQIQGSFFRSPTSNRGYSGSPAGSRYQNQLSAAVAYAKLMQERSGAALKSSQLLFHNELQEKQRLLEERQVNSLQDFQREVGRIDQSESLSSLDSLENEGPSHRPALSCSSSENSEVLDCTRPQSPRKHFNSHDDLRWQQNRTVAGSCAPTKDTEETGEYGKTTQAKGEPIADSQKPAPATSHQSTFTQKGIIGNVVHLPSKSDPQNCASEKAPTTILQISSIREGIVGNVVHPACLGEVEKSPTGTPCKAWGSPETTPPESARPTYGDVHEESAQVDKFINHPEATQIVLPSALCSDRDNPGCSSEDPSAIPSAMSQMSADREASVSKAIERTSYRHDRHLASGDKDADCETGSTRTRPSDPCDLKPGSSRVKVNQGDERDVPTRHALASTSDTVSKAIRGILKKESKYAITGHAKLTFSPAGYATANHFSVSVKDSVEVVKQRERDSEAGKRVKKKLRWFDEVCCHEEEQENKPLQDGTRPQTQGPGKPSVPPQGKATLVGQQEGPVPATVLEKTTPGPQVVPSTTPAGHHSTKQAWGNGRGPERERGEVARPDRGALRRARPRGPRRVRSARARLGPAPPRTRKGVAVRPQSATEASQVHKGTQGRIIVPRPPPKPASSESGPALDPGAREEGRAPNAAKSAFGEVHGRVGPPADQRDVHQGHVVPPGNSAPAVTCGAPFPPSYNLSAYETVSKAAFGQQEALGVASRRGPLYVEYGLNLAKTPTEEEISQLWCGVRSALAPKEGEPQTIAACNGLLSGLSQGRANLSHVTIDGSSLIGGVRSVTRMGGFFVTASNATKNMIRKQSADGTGTKHRALLEQRRLNSGPGTRKPPVPSQTTVQISPLGCKADQIGVALQDEVSESTAQFLLAEALAEGSATDDDIMAAMETGPQQRPMPAGPGLSALSLEEQRLLLSLDRLNHRLQCVQGAAAGNASVRGVLQNAAPAVSVPEGTPGDSKPGWKTSAPSLLSRGGEGRAVAQRRCHTHSADGRSRAERRY